MDFIAELKIICKCFFMLFIDVLLQRLKSEISNRIKHNSFICGCFFLYRICACDTLLAQNKFSVNDTTNPFYATITYRMACDFATKRQTDSCIHFISHYLSHTERKTGIVDILSSPEINNNLKGERWMKMRDSMIKELKILYGDKLNIPLFIRLLQYEAEDQGARWEALSPTMKFKYPKGGVDTLNLKHLKLVDSLLSNTVELNKITVGIEGMNAIFLFIQHCQDTIRQQKYAPQIKSWVTFGDIKGSSYALYLDRLRINHNQPQIYGTQFWRDENVNQLVLYPIENIADVNNLRKQMGMKSIQYDLLNYEFFEGKKFRRESVAGLLKETDNLQDYISKEIDK